MSHFHLRFNDTMPHSIPVGVNLITSIFNMYVLKAQNKKPHPIKTTFKELPNLKPKWTYDTSAFVSIMLIGMGFVLFPGSFAILIVAQRQVNLKLGSNSCTEFSRTKLVLKNERLGSKVLTGNAK